MKTTTPRKAAPLCANAALELASIPDHRVPLRLLAISKCATTPAAQVADFFDVSPSTLRRWQRAFEEGGAEALADRPRGHRAAKLGPEHLRILGHWLRSRSDAAGAPKHWTLVALQRAVREEFGIEISLMPLWRHLQLSGHLRYLPHHHRLTQELPHAR
jgi:transposase